MSHLKVGGVICSNNKTIGIFFPNKKERKMLNLASIEVKLMFFSTTTTTTTTTKKKKRQINVFKILSLIGKHMESTNVARILFTVVKIHFLYLLDPSVVCNVS